MMSKRLSHVKVPDSVINTSLARLRQGRKETAEPVIVLGSTGVVLGKKEVPGNIHNFDEMGNEYICGFVEKICTHNPEFIIKPENDDRLFDYYMVPVDFEVFKDEAAAGLSGQTERLVRQVYKVFSNPRPCYIPKADGSGYKAMPPFIIALETADKQSLSAADIQRLERLQNDKSPDPKNKIGIIKIYFAKDLFQGLLEDRERWHFLANGFYPYLYHFAKISQETAELVELEENKKDESKKDPWLKSIARGTRRDDGRVISAYKRFYYYLCKHDNREGDRIPIDIYDLCRNVAPQFLEESNPAMPRIRKPSGMKFLHAAIGIINQVPGIPFAIDVKSGADDPGFSYFKINRNYIPKNYKGALYPDAKKGAWRDSDER
jgi:hypothetical protein